MNRQERNRYDNRSDYGRYDDYRNDSNYHSARNLTDDFEQDFQRERGGHFDDDRYSRNRSYHEGNMGNAYERMSREGGSRRGNTSYDMQNRDYSQNFNRQRDRYSNFQDDYRSYRDNDRDNRYSNDRDRRGNISQGYGISDYGGTSDRYNTLDSNQNRGYDQYNYSGSRGNYRGGGYSGDSMGESSVHSDRGIPNYGRRTANDFWGTGSTYGGSNYGGGTGYSEGHRGGAFGNEVHGSSSGNYGGSGSMGGGTYGGRSNSGWGNTSHNTDRGTREYGGF